jgi:hypothetical protein
MFGWSLVAMNDLLARAKVGLIIGLVVKCVTGVGNLPASIETVAEWVSKKRKILRQIILK